MLFRTYSLWLFHVVLYRVEPPYIGGDIYLYDVLLWLGHVESRLWDIRILYILKGSLVSKD